MHQNYIPVQKQEILQHSWSRQMKLLLKQLNEHGGKKDTINTLSINLSQEQFQQYHQQVLYNH